MPGGFDRSRSGGSGAMGGDRRAGYRAAGPGSTDHAATIGDCSPAPAVGAPIAAGDDGRPRYDTIAVRRYAELFACQLDRTDEFFAWQGDERICLAVRRRAERHYRQRRAVTAAFGNALVGRSATNTGRAPVERHAAGS